MEITRAHAVWGALCFLAVVGLCASVITAEKIVAIGPLIFPASNIVFSLLTFPITDIVSEIWGRRDAFRVVYVSLAGQVLFVALIQGSIVLPAAPTWAHQEAYAEVLGAGPRLLAASLVAFLTSQVWDVYVYSRLKRLSRGRFLWLRNNLSTFTSQLINSTVYITVAFSGSQPVLQLIQGSMVLKWAIAAVDTPIVYFGVLTIHRFLGGSTHAFDAQE